MSEDEGSYFKKMARLSIDDAFNIIKSELSGEPYQPIEWPKSKYYILYCLENHTRHIDAGIGGAHVECKIGDIIETQDLSIHSVDISKWRLLRTEER